MSTYKSWGKEFQLLPNNWQGWVQLFLVLVPIPSLLLAYNWFHDNIPYKILFYMLLIIVSAWIFMTRIAQKLSTLFFQKIQTLDDLKSKKFGRAYSIFWDINRDPYCPYCPHKPPIRSKHKKGMEFLYCHSCKTPVWGKTWYNNHNMGYKELKEKIDKVDFSSFPNLKDFDES